MTGRPVRHDSGAASPTMAMRPRNLSGNWQYPENGVNLQLIMSETKSAKRNTVISICKGIAIILMVVGHAEAPGLITNFIYTFHMPLFFMAAGYFFSRKYLDTPWTFISRRLKTLYLPFLKWSIFFLLMHNIWFHLGILNEEYGNWTGGVTHPYSPADAVQRLVMMVFGMSGYDEFMAGAFWFFRGLLLASVGFLLLYKILDARTRLNPTMCVVAICLLMVGFTALHIHYGFRISVIPNGGWRETWGIFFFGAGVLFHTYESRLRQHWAITLFFVAFLCFAAVQHFSGMNNSGRMADLITLPLTGTVGFLAVHHLSTVIDRHDTRLRRWLVFIGDNTLYIFILHIMAFKPVSMLKIWYYDLDPAQIGCHMVIHYNNTDFFWVVYSIAGVALPVGALLLWRALRTHFSRKAVAA